MEIPEVVFSFPLEKFITRRGQTWDVSSPVKKAGAMAFLVDNGWPPAKAKYLLDSPDLQTVIYGTDLCPGEPPIFMDDSGRRMLNLWTPPTLQVKEGPFPRIRLVTEHLANGDPEALRYLDHAFAQKYQDPNKLPKVAIVIATTQGAGKGFMYRVISEMLGVKNCAVVTQAELESNFSGRYARCLFILGDEVISADNPRDISQKLKVLIDGGEIEMERKYENQVAIRNRAMWLFASNSQVSPLQVEGSDRRYTFFSNFSSPPPEYTSAMNSCFEADRTTLTASFKEEIAGYAWYLRHLAVDYDFVSRPYKNAARDNLIEANRSSHDMFCREMDENGFDVLYEAAKRREFSIGNQDDRKDWDFGEDGVATGTLYAVYRAYCKDSGQFPLRLNKFGAALKNHLPAWRHSRQDVKSGGKTVRRVWCYAVPRKGRNGIE